MSIKLFPFYFHIIAILIPLYILQLSAAVCCLTIWAYIPSFAESSSGVPSSATTPSFKTTMWSAFAMVRIL